MGNSSWTRERKVKQANLAMFTEGSKDQVPPAPTPSAQEQSAARVHARPEAH